jgi:ABC-type Na+ efflux pump permease subunit
MKRNEPGMFLCRALVSLIVVLMMGFLGLGVRAFETADTTQFIFFAACVISVAILALYFMLRRPLENRRAISRFVNLPSWNLSFCAYAQSVGIHSIWIICLKEPL